MTEIFNIYLDKVGKRFLGIYQADVPERDKSSSFTFDIGVQQVNSNVRNCGVSRRVICPSSQGYVDVL